MIINQNNVSLVAKQAEEAYHTGDFITAARLYGEASAIHTQAGNTPAAAEMANNQSVAWLKGGDAAQALIVTQGTEVIFAAAGDLRRQGMAIGNQAAALEALGRWKEAEEHYQHSAEILKAAGENELCSLSLQSLSSLQLRHKDQFGAMATMQTALQSKKRLSIRDRFLQWLLQVVFKLLNRS